MITLVPNITWIKLMFTEPKKKQITGGWNRKKISRTEKNEKYLIKEWRKKEKCNWINRPKFPTYLEWKKNGVGFHVIATFESPTLTNPSYSHSWGTKSPVTHVSQLQRKNLERIWRTPTYKLKYGARKMMRITI